ncbi:MAG TPA: ABC transporter permease [Chitinophagaceae bacterium]
MFKSYIKIAFRNLSRHKLFSVLNILCLSIGITFSMIIGVYVLQQHRVNEGLKDLDNQYYVKSNWKIQGMGVNITTLGPLAKTLKDEYPGLVASYYRFNPVTNVVSAGDRHFKEDVAICDTTLVSMYGFPLVCGNKDNVFPNPNSALLTETLARKLFGRTNVLGERVSMQTLNTAPQDFVVSGVMKDPSYNTVTGSFTEVRDCFGMFVPIRGNRYYPGGNQVNEGGDGSGSWLTWNYVSLLELNKGVSPARLDNAFKQILQKHTSKDVQENLRVELAPLRTYYIREKNAAVGQMINTLSLVALFILLMAIINFVNINIGTSAYRLKEIGLRKVFGGERVQLMVQFLLESFMLTLLAGLISLWLYELLRPAFDSILQTQLDHVWQFGWSNILLFVLLILVVGIISGIYPAFMLSSPKISIAVKGKLDAAKGGLLLRKTLLVVQFTMAIVVFIGALTVFRQVSYVFAKDLGYNRDRLMVITPFPKEWDPAGVAKIESIRQGLLQLPAVKDGSLSSELPETPGLTQGYIPEGSKDNKPLLIPTFISDENFVRTFGLHLEEGAFFNEKGGAYTHNQVVLNESAVKAFGWKTAVGKKLRLPQGGPEQTVAGVIRDFNYANLQQSITPMVFANLGDAPVYRVLTVKLNSPDLAAAVDAVRAKWKTLSPNAPFEYVFMDDRFKAIYRHELQLRNAAAIGTVLNLVIVFMGIFGVVAFTLVKRGKEMAIRKVLGAGVRTIILLFIRDYALLIIIANIIGWPVAYLLSRQWLQNFAYRAPQDIIPYLFVLVFIFVAVSLLVAAQCLRTAIESPVEKLRAE